jgi:transposase
MRNAPPDEHLVDSGYVDGEHLAASRASGIRLVGPTMPDTSWQAKEGRGFDLAHFSIDWQKQQATCPQGQTSSRMSPKGQNLEIVFARETCAGCPVRQDCTHSQTTGRVLCVRPQAAHEALQQQRQVEQTPAFRQTYGLRAGIESTFSQGVRTMGLRRSRYDGLIRTHVQQILTAVAINLVRIDAVLTRTARGTTRRSHFAQLVSHPSLRPRAVA